MPTGPPLSWRRNTHPPPPAGPSRSFGGSADREWAYVSLSRGREANTLYLANPEPDDHQCTHLTQPERRDALDGLTTSLARSSTQTAAIDQFVGWGAAVSAVIDAVGSQPSNDVLERVARIVARRRLCQCCEVSSRSSDRSPRKVSGRIINSADHGRCWVEVSVRCPSETEK